MPSEFIQRQIDRLLEQAADALPRFDWTVVRESAAAALGLDPENADAKALLTLAEARAAVASPEPPATPTDAAPPTEPTLLSSLPAREGGTATTASSTTHDPRPSTFVNGRYRVEHLLGEGGKKKVYLARDTVLRREVAFALIKTEGLDKVGREHIRREGEAMGALGAHPHIVTVFDLGELPAASSEQRATSGTSLPGPLPLGQAQGAAFEGRGSLPLSPRPLGEGQGEGTPYMVTELMKGGDVEGLIEKAPEHKLPLAEALRIADEVCQGLEFAHSKGIVHRDLKPGNVWLTEAVGSRQVGSGGGAGTTADCLLPTALAGTAKIGDFGLAVSLDRTRLTQAGMMVGTVSYMPPEQATGGAVTPRSDLYSLGAMLYEMVCGRPPFLGDDAVAIIGQHLNVPPVSPAWHRRDCPPGLEALILRLLEKDPSKRPSSAAEVRAVLQSIGGALASPPAPSPGGPGEGMTVGGAGPTADSLLPTAPAENPLYRRVFVGREAELRQLQAALDGALGGQGGLVMVVGEPGIGKTALVKQLATYAALRQASTLWGHCYEEGSLSLPYLAFVEAIRSYVTARPADALRRELGSAAGDLARIVSEVRERLSIEPRPPSEPEEDRWRLLQAVSGFLRAASLVQPLVIVLEDLHWADQGTLDLLVHLARNLQGARLLVIGTYRDVEVDRAHPLSAALADLRRGSSFARVQLRGLGTPEVQRMLAAIAGQGVPGSLAEAIHRQTEGNPLFVQEVVRYLVEEGKLGQGTREGTRPSPTEPGTARLASGPARPSTGSGRASAAGGLSDADMAIPEGLRNVIGRRLSRLSPECNRVLAISAVIGRDFGLVTLRAVTDLDEETVVSALEEALHIAVLEDQSRLGEVRYRFAHAFFRQTLYEELIAPRRLRLHQQVAAALERQYASRLEEHAAELAEHFAQSTDRDDLGKAVRYGELAAQRALGVYAYGEAVRHLEQALAVQEVLNPDDRAKRCDLLLALGRALTPAGDLPRVYEVIAPQAFALAETLNDRGRASRACWLATWTIWRYGGPSILGSEQFRRWAERAGHYATEGTVERVYADLALSQVLLREGRLEETLSLRTGALTLARQLGDPEVIFDAAAQLLLSYGPNVVPRLMDRRLALELADEFCSRPHERVPVRTFVLVLNMAAHVYADSGLRDRWETIARQITELAERTRDANALHYARTEEANRALFDGDLERVVAAAVTLRDQREELGASLSERRNTEYTAFRARGYLGRWQEALAEDELLSADEERAGAPLATGGMIGAGALQRHVAGLAYTGRSGEAQAMMQRMIADLRDAGSGVEFSRGMTVQVLEAATLLDDKVITAQLAEELKPAADSATCNTTFTCAARHLGAAAALLGDREQAMRYYEQALEVCGRLRFRPELALTHLGIAELLLDEAASSEGRATGAEVASSEQRATRGAAGSSLSLAGEGRGEGEGRDVLDARAAPHAPILRLAQDERRDGPEARAPGEQRAEAMRHLDIAIEEFREMKMQPSLERALRHKEVLKA